jgi:hypothetical protein
MTLRAFLVGLVAVGTICLVTPYNDIGLANTYMTGFHFPMGAFFLLVLLTLVGNLVVKAIRRAWAFGRSELMLVWCMMIVASTVPSSGLMRYWFPVVAAPSYHATSSQQQHWANRGHVLDRTPRQLVLSKEPGDRAAEMFYQGPPTGEEMDIPWGAWAEPLVTWGVFLMLYYLATLFLCSILRGYWVESERLAFPLAKVPLELTEGSGESHLLPGLVKNKFFLFGAALSLIAGGLRLSPLVQSVGFPLGRVLKGTFLEHAGIGGGAIFPLAIGFAYLIPAQISFSLWFFWLASRMELLTAHYAGTPLGGTGGPFMQWQQAAAFVAFTAVLIWKARRHIAGVVRKAVGRGGEVDDSGEPISHRLSFWGFLACVAGMVGWFWYFEMNPFVALLLLALMFSVLLVHARLVAQAGLFFVQQIWAPVEVVHSITGGYGLSAPAIVVANMQSAILVSDSREIFSPHAMNALRIAEVFKKHRRLFLPAMLSALVLGLVVASWSGMRVYYADGAYNVGATYASKSVAPRTFETAERMIMRPRESADVRVVPALLGGTVMVGLLALRMKFYWWPLHPLGFLVATTYAMGTMWFSFFLGWLVKVLIMYFGGGKALRGGRNFFLGVIVTEASLVGACAVAGLITGERIGGFIFLPG